MQRETVPLDRMREIVAGFRIPGDVLESGPHGTGHIHDTYAVTVGQPPARRRYVLQRINHGIFRDVPALMENIGRVTAHLRAKIEARGGDPDRETLTLVPARDGASFARTEDSAFWRAYLFIEGARTFDVPETSRQAEEAARAFARFQKDLADLPDPPLRETIPNFHHTVKRFETLHRVIDEDRANRAARCRPEIDAYLGLESRAVRVTRAVEAGELPLRVTHSDTKINNVMIDDRSGEGVCVIDLDTAMHGSVLFDFGDQIRTAVGRHQENERDLDKVIVDLERFESLVRGYLPEARGFLTPLETDLLAFSGQVLALEIGARFLTDFLQGDVYFKVHRPDENLDRTRTQITLAQRLIEKEDAMNRIVARYRG